MGTELTQKARRKAIDRMAIKDITADEPKVNELAGEDDVKNLESRRSAEPHSDSESGFHGGGYDLVMREYYEKKPIEKDTETRRARVKAMRKLMVDD